MAAAYLAAAGRKFWCWNATAGLVERGCELTLPGFRHTSIP
jgi:hypothetical protein